MIRWRFLKFALIAADFDIVIITIRLKPFWGEWKCPGGVCSKFAAPWARALVASAVLPLIATTTADVPSAHIRPIPAFVSQPVPKPASKLDPRIDRLERFFKIYHCPAPHHTSEYLRAADGYGLDYRLLPAVSIRETLCGKATRQENNHWGFHRQSFPSVQVGIEFLARRLSQHRFYKGKTLQDKLFAYNPLPAYPEEVKRIMRQIE
jgi:hypothetical protein